MARTRSAVAREAVMEAAADAIVEHGVERLTIDDVAVRSGVAKTTIYRHWPSKAALVVDAVASATKPLPTPDTGEPHADLVACFEGIGTEPESERVALLYLAVLEAARRDAELDRLADRLREERQRPVHTVVELARLRGHIAAETDVATVVELLAASVVYRRLVLRKAVRRADIARVIDTVLPELADPARRRAVV